MQIMYYGLSCFRFSSKPSGRGADDVVMYADPLYEKNIRSVYGKANIILCSQDKDCVTDAFKGEIKVFDSPGEYSALGVDILGISASAEKFENTIFVVRSEDIRIAHLGRLRRSLEEKELEKLGVVDILFLPVGGGDFLDAKRASQMVRTIEPKVVVPMMFDFSGTPYALDDVQKFLVEMGVSEVKKQDKWVFKKKDLPEKGVEVVLFSSQR